MDLTWHRHREREGLQGVDQVNAASPIMCCIRGGSRHPSSAIVAAVACLCFLSVSALVLLPSWLIRVDGKTTDAPCSSSPDSGNALWSSWASSLSSTSPETIGNRVPSLPRSDEQTNLRPAPRIPRRPPGSRSVTRRRLMFTAVPGSYPPRCTAKCGNCNPCKPVHVPVPPGRLVTTMEYYPEAWRCKCGNVLYMP